MSIFQVRLKRTNVRKMETKFGQLLFGAHKESSDDGNTVEEAKTRLREKLELLSASSDCSERTNKDLKGFRKLFGQFLDGGRTEVDWEKVERLHPTSIIPYGELLSPANAAEVKDLLSKLVIVKLNGGLGTSMGCKGPKSLIPVRGGKTFLDLTVEQVQHLNKTYNIDVPLVLMNSFNTEIEAAAALSKYQQSGVSIYSFNQSSYPRICQETLMPVATDLVIKENKEAWYPPGHGDFYQSFHSSGLLDDFLCKEKQCVFVSNIDNLGATVDSCFLRLVLKGGKDFVMEVTDKTQADVKGGTLIQYNGQLQLLEVAQVPKAHVGEFQSIKKFQTFNTNNLWLNMIVMKDLVEQDKLKMELIINPKKLDSGRNVYQLETAVGAAMKCFDNSVGVNVPRARFLPVKKTSDLLLLMSDLYSEKNGSLIMSSERVFHTMPLVKLGDQHFKKVNDFQKRFTGIPNILELDHLTVSGNITFGKNVSLKGTVIIIANQGDQIDIPNGAILENKIVSGNLRILDH